MAPVNPVTNYVNAVMRVDPITGAAIPISDVQVTVRKVGTTDPALTPLYTDRSGTVAAANPFLTVGGRINFWAEEGYDYNISVVDTIVPKRVNDETWGWAPGVHTPFAAPIMRTATTYPIQGAVNVPSGDNFVLPPFPMPERAPGQAVTFVKVKHILLNASVSNRVTFKITKNNIDVPEYSGSNALTTGTSVAWVTSDAADIPITDEDSLAIVVTGIVGSPKNLSVALLFDHALGGS
jgi:hypothetical protein